MSINYFNSNHSECNTAGKYPKKQRMILMIKSLPAPFIKKTANGANRIEMMIIKSLLEDAAIVLSLVLIF